MRVSPSAAEVRGIVERVFQELGVSGHHLDELSETLLLDDGRCRARSYRAADLMAMWLVEVGILQFYDADGNLLHRANLLAEIAPRRMAA